MLQLAAKRLKVLEAALACGALEQPKLPIAALPQALLFPAKKSICKLFGYIRWTFKVVEAFLEQATRANHFLSKD
jgi:hypothetical protein